MILFILLLIPHLIFAPEYTTTVERGFISVSKPKGPNSNDQASDLNSKEKDTPSQDEFINLLKPIETAPKIFKFCRDAINNSENQLYTRGKRECQQLATMFYCLEHEPKKSNPAKNAKSKALEIFCNSASRANEHVVNHTVKSIVDEMNLSPQRTVDELEKFFEAVESFTKNNH